MFPFTHKIWRIVCMVLFSLSLAYSPASYAEEAEIPSTALAKLLEQVQNAARQLDYSGVLSYSSEAGTESMSLVHIVDGKGERERLAVLDGVEREFIRTNDVIQCLIPDKELVIIEKPRDGRFPALLVGDTIELEKFYTFTEGGLQRVAGRECQQYSLLPIDEWRYGYKFCVDNEYHLLLKLQTLDLNSTPKVINQVAFANVKIGEEVEVHALDTAWKYNDWKIIAAQMQPVDLAAQGWRIPYPTGFVPVNEVSRFIRSDRQVAQLVLSDGLASISVFIEPVDKLSQRLEADSGSRNGSTHLYRKRIGEYWLTATGEIPLETLHYLGNNTEFVPVPK